MTSIAVAAPIAGSPSACIRANRSLRDGALAYDGRSSWIATPAVITPTHQITKEVDSRSNSPVIGCEIFDTACHARGSEYPAESSGAEVDRCGGDTVPRRCT